MKPSERMTQRRANRRFMDAGAQSMSPVAPTPIADRRPDIQIPTGVAERADSTILPDLESRLLAGVEARLAEEMWRLIGALRQFSSRTQLIGEAAPEGAEFCQAITLFFSLSSIQAANVLAQITNRRLLLDDGRKYLSELCLGFDDLFKQIDLDGRRFFAIALIDERPGQGDDGGKTA